MIKQLTRLVIDNKIENNKLPPFKFNIKIIYPKIPTKGVRKLKNIRKKKNLYK
jgi:hypothetical protein